MIERELATTLMDIGLGQKEKETFTNAFKRYCNSMKPDQIGAKHCELLDKNLTTFLLHFPGYSELPILYAELLQNHVRWTPTKQKDTLIEDAIERVRTLASGGSIEAIEYLKTVATKSSAFSQVDSSFEEDTDEDSAEDTPEEPKTKKRKTFQKEIDSESDMEND